jgi:hypothetical protein
MEKTLQQQYTLIREGKGNKDHFLKQARNLFPEFITPVNDYNTTVHILKSKSILSETAIGGVITSNPNKPDWFKIFDTNLKEAVGVKNTKEYGDQNEFEKIDKQVQDALDHQFDNKDDKNIDNVYGQSFLMGYYTEMKDPKNADKTVDELKAIVLKNMVKDINYYHTEASFGVKEIGYTKDVVGGGDAIAPKGKYKSSGYGDMPKAKVVKESLNEAKKSNVQTRIKDLEKQNEVLALESKIASLDEAINELTQKVSLSESDELTDMMDPKKINELKKDIKVLEKYKMTCEKKLSKLGGKKTIVDENKDEDYGGLNPEDYDLMDDGSMVDPETGKVVWSPTNEKITENENENPPNKYTFVDKKVVRRISPQNGDKSYDIQFDDRTEKTIYASHDDWDKINSIYQKAKNG